MHWGTLKCRTHGLDAPEICANIPPSKKKLKTHKQIANSWILRDNLARLRDLGKYGTHIQQNSKSYLQMLKLVDSFLKFLTHTSNFSSVPLASSLTAVYMMCYRETQSKTNSITYNNLPWMNLLSRSGAHFLNKWHSISWMMLWNYVLFLLYVTKSIFWHTQLCMFNTY